MQNITIITEHKGIKYQTQKECQSEKVLSWIDGMYNIIDLDIICIDVIYNVSGCMIFVDVSNLDNNKNCELKKII